VPQKKEMKQMWTTIVLTFSRSQQMISKVRMCEKNGDYTLIEMKNVKQNKPVSDAHFNVR
ncbi:MAG: outer-membrane lipoprotein carrier protein LolA, partial [Bacteroidaceae bacterium]|nr:outer-membrane lipoprotein carrier protein LolA [Bacteroidaceae bacterium]